MSELYFNGSIRHCSLSLKPEGQNGANVDALTTPRNYSSKNPPLLSQHVHLLLLVACISPPHATSLLPDSTIMFILNSHYKCGTNHLLRDLCTFRHACSAISFALFLFMPHLSYMQYLVSISCSPLSYYIMRDPLLTSKTLCTEITKGERGFHW